MININEKKLNYKQQRDAKIEKYNLLINKLHKELQALNYESLDAQYTQYLKSYSIDIFKKYRKANLTLIIEYEIIVQSASSITTSFSMSFKSGGTRLHPSDMPMDLKNSRKDLITIVEKELKLKNDPGTLFFFIGQDDFVFTDENLKTKIFAVTKKIPSIVSKIKKMMNSSGIKRL